MTNGDIIGLVALACTVTTCMAYVIEGNYSKAFYFLTISMSLGSVAFMKG